MFCHVFSPSTWTHIDLSLRGSQPYLFTIADRPNIHMDPLPAASAFVKAEKEVLLNLARWAAGWREQLGGRPYSSVGGTPRWRDLPQQPRAAPASPANSLAGPPHTAPLRHAPARALPRRNRPAPASNNSVWPLCPPEHSCRGHLSSTLPPFNGAILSLAAVLLRIKRVLSRQGLAL